MTNESRTIRCMRKGDSMQNGRFFHRFWWQARTKISNQTLHLHKSSTLQTCLCRFTVKVSACAWARMNLFVMWHYLALCSVPHLQEESLLQESHDTHTHAEKHQSLSFNRKLMPSLLLKDLDLWQVHEHILNQAGQMKLEGSSWKPCTGSCQFALMAPNAITKAHAKQLLWISMICKGYK